MKTKDLCAITMVALGTATLTVAAFLGNTLEAGDDATPPAPAITRPEFVANGIKVTLAPSERREFKAGDSPTFNLSAVNTLAESSEARICLTMTATAPSSELSRMLVMPSVLWQQELTITLGPDGTRTVPVNTQAILPANSLISVSLTAVDPSRSSGPARPAAGGETKPQLSPLLQPGIVALSFSTVTNTLNLAFAPGLQASR